MKMQLNFKLSLGPLKAGGTADVWFQLAGSAGKVQFIIDRIELSNSHIPDVAANAIKDSLAASISQAITQAIQDLPEQVDVVDSVEVVSVSE